MEEAQTQEPAVEQAPAQEAVTETPQEAPVQEPQVQEAPAPETKAPFEIFDNPADLAASMQREAAEAASVQQDVTPQPEAPNPVEPQAVQPEPQQAQYTQEDVEGAVLGFLSERLGRQVTSFDDFAQPRQLDERIETIARFVEETGKRPEDWFAYQRLNTSEMDDMTAIRVQMAADNPTLSNDEINLLVQSKYRLSSEASEDDKRLVQLQMKMDGQKAKAAIEDLRQGYKAPEVQPTAAEPEKLVDEAWVSEMAENVDAMTGLEFDLGNENTFMFGLEDDYKNELKHKNANLENYFDPYVREDGSWDYDLLSSHRTVIDNIDRIVQAAYRQGMSEGQRGVVQNAANVQAKAPDDVSGQQNSNPLGEQVRQILQRNRSTMTFNI
jgi:hypothetical protein|tara:strand:- start:150 stop:1298 length:1149 start_codon:yes stop_codon:yes gene_type:complete